MNYLSGLKLLKDRVAKKHDNFFLILESRLLENLEDEKLYGANEKNKSERARIIYELNSIALDSTGKSFNDFCQGLDIGKSQSGIGNIKLDLNNQEGVKLKKIFISYSHKDIKILKDIEKHLASLKREGIVSTWTDREISAGAEWESEIMNNLTNSEIILFLISSDFINSNYCYDIEVKKAMELHEQGMATVVPIIVRPTDWEKMPFGKLQALPPLGKPITDSDWKSKDHAYLEVIKGIRGLIEKNRK